jgi:hypothetical protein
MLISVIVSFGCTSFLMEQCGSCWEFLKSLFLGLNKISIDKIKVLLKLDKNNTYFIYRHVYIYIYYWILLVLREVSNEGCRENQNTCFKLYLVFRNCHFERFYKKYTRTQSKEIIVVSRFVVVVLLLSSYTKFVSLWYFPMDVTDFIHTVYIINN